MRRPIDGRGQDETVLVLTGPTGSGKSALAMAIARRMPAVVINADSMQVYRPLRVLTARPSDDDEAEVPHRLYGVLSASDPCSAVRWAQRAACEITAAWARGWLPIVVGGSGLYLRALIEGIVDVPEIAAPVRHAVRARFAAEGVAGVRAALVSLDPVGARLSDPQRLQRALEVVLATGRPLSEWQRQPPVRPFPQARFVIVAFAPPRERLYPTLDRRFEAMLDAGALGEVAALIAAHPDPAWPVRRAVGVRELACHLQGTLSFADAKAAAQAATRRYAKRQLTWLRHQIVADQAILGQFSDYQEPEIFSFIRRFLLTASK